MESFLHTKGSWPAERALAFLCCGSAPDENCDDIAGWLRTGEGDKGSPLRGRQTSLDRAIDVIRKLWPTQVPELHPIVWLWLGASQFRRSLHKRCLAELVAYIELSLEDGYRPMLRRIPLGKPSMARHRSSLTDEDGEPFDDLLVATLPLRPFEASIAEQPWKSHLQPNDAPKPGRKSKSSARPKRSGASPRCIAVVRRLVDEAAARGELVSPATGVGGPPYISLKLKRPGLVKALKAAKGGKALSQFGVSTAIRAMSAVVRCEPGRSRLE